MQKSGHMVLKGVNWVHNDKITSHGTERSQLGYTMIKLGEMVWKGVNLLHNDKNRSSGLERSQLVKQYKNHII